MNSRRAVTLTLLASLSWGCAQTPYLGVRSAEPPPPRTAPGVVRTEEVLEGAEGVPLYARAYRPATGEVRGAVVILNGLEDHGDNYAELSQALVRSGYAAYAFDLRGHGRSGGERVAVRRFDDFVDDLASYVEHVRAREPEKPIIVFGHSLGGLTSALYAIERRPHIAGVILSAPAVAIDGPPIQLAFLRFFGAVTPRAPLLDPAREDFSRDPAVVAAMARDPLVHQGKGPAHTAAEMASAMHRVWAHPERLTVPLLVLHGTADALTAASGSRDLVARAGHPDRTLRLYEGLVHDLVHEPERARVVGDIVAWVDAHATAPGVAASPAAPGVTSERQARDRALAAGPLRGDRASSLTSVALDARGERAVSPGDDVTAVTAGLRVRQGFGRAGWLGGIDLRAGSEAGFRWEADAHPLGLGVRGGPVLVGLTGGIGARGIDGITVVRSPVELSVESSLGPVRLLSRASLAWRWNRGGPGTSVLGVADEANALLGVRLGRDLGYWARVRAGQGPFLGLTYARRDSADLWGLAVGLDFWGEN